jgi:4'-phosphopantetheinyl transferase
VPYAAVVLARTKEGKPYVPVRGDDAHSLMPSFNLNVSHHGDWVVLASEPHDLVGVDVMKNELRPTTTEAEFLACMRHVFTDAEWRLVDAASPHRLDAFHTLWCLKESLIKATGIGLGFDLQRASFSFVGWPSLSSPP